MHSVESSVIENREAVEAFVAAARAVPAGAWLQPRAAGKWSPAQVTEHVAIAYDVARTVLDGTFKGRSAPRIVRPLIRAVAVNRILKAGRYTSGLKAPAFFQPAEIRASAAELTGRLHAATDGFEHALRARAQQGFAFVDHPFFGRVALADYSRLQALHTRHHLQQLRVGP